MAEVLIADDLNFLSLISYGLEIDVLTCVLIELNIGRTGEGDSEISECNDVVLNTCDDTVFSSLVLDPDIEVYLEVAVDVVGSKFSGKINTVLVSYDETVTVAAGLEEAGTGCVPRQILRYFAGSLVKAAHIGGGQSAGPLCIDGGILSKDGVGSNLGAAYFSGVPTVEGVGAGAGVGGSGQAGKLAFLVNGSGSGGYSTLGSVEGYDCRLGLGLRHLAVNGSVKAKNADRLTGIHSAVRTINGNNGLNVVECTLCNINGGEGVIALSELNDSSVNSLNGELAVLNNDGQIGVSSVAIVAAVRIEACISAGRLSINILIRIVLISVSYNMLRNFAASKSGSDGITHITAGKGGTGKLSGLADGYPVITGSAFRSTDDLAIFKKENIELATVGSGATGSIQLYSNSVIAECDVIIGTNSGITVDSAAPLSIHKAGGEKLEVIGKADFLTIGELTGGQLPHSSGVEQSGPALNGGGALGHINDAHLGSAVEHAILIALGDGPVLENVRAEEVESGALSLVVVILIANGRRSSAASGSLSITTRKVTNATHNNAGTFLVDFNR